jgi:alkylated DNA repair dioxygenase AlkB
MQFDLFADEALPSIPGLIYQADFLTPEEEKGLLEIIATLPLMPARYKEYESKVRILSFGGLYDFNTHTVKSSPALDARLVPLRNRIADWLRIEHGAISHLLVTEYLPGTQLGWHRDVPVYETIVGISLGNSATILPAWHMNKEHWVSVILEGPLTADEIHNLLSESHRLTPA